MEEYTLDCDFCQRKFCVSKSKHKRAKYEKKKDIKFFCCEKCRLDSRGFKEKMQINCPSCQKPFSKTHNKKNKNYFCSQSCAATYNNQNKTHGTRRSKLEKWLEEQLAVLFPSLEIHFNRKDSINSELDIYIPNLKLAFELNGIFHYEPIYGADKLSQIQNNDGRKFQACLEKGIELCILDTSKLSYFKPANAQKYLDIIVEILNQKLVPRPEVESG